MKKAMHPSGMTLERWNWPFKTPEERKLVVKYFRKLNMQQKRNMPPAPF